MTLRGLDNKQAHIPYPVFKASADRKTRTELLEDIENFCKGYGPGERETVLLIGKPGVGKSAAINTIAKVVNGEYIVISKIGDGSTSRTEEIAL